MVETYKLFLDDYRVPLDCVGYMHSRIGARNPVYLEKDWVVVKHYFEFCEYIKNHGLPYLVSFDHDLADAHYNDKYQDGVIDYASEDFNKNYFKTGYHCAEWLIEYCMENQLDFPPEYFVHSMNPAGTENIHSLIKSYLKQEEMLKENPPFGGPYEKEEFKIEMTDKNGEIWINHITITPDPYEFARDQEIERKIANDEQRRKIEEGLRSEGKVEQGPGKRDSHVSSREW